MQAIPKGASVRQCVPVITGTVQQTKFNEATGELEYLVIYTDADGHAAERWFLQSQIEQVPA